MKKLLNKLNKFLSTGTTESSTRLFTFMIIAVSLLCIIAIVIVAIVNIFTGNNDISSLINLTITLASFATSALIGKVVNTINEK